jgi:heptosyltransferase-2
MSMSGARWRLGYTEQMHARKKLVNANYDLFYTHTVKDTCLKHEVEHNLFLLTAFDATAQSQATKIWIDGSDEIYAEKILSAHKSAGTKPLIAMCVGATGPAKEWPISRYAMVARWMVQQYDATIVIIGGHEDTVASEELAQAAAGSVINCAGKTTLRQCAALLKHCHLYVGNDTGPMHLAASFGVPVVGIFACPADVPADQVTIASRFSPWQTKSVLVQPASAQGTCA